MAYGLTHKICEERVNGLILKIDGVRVQRLTHKICEERVDGLILKIDGVRVQRLTHNISEERADGLTQWLVDGDGSESGGFRRTGTRTISCLRRTQRKIESLSALDCVRCEKTWRSSFDEIENEVHDEKCWRGWSDDGLGGVEWPRRWLRWRRCDGFDGVDGAVGGLVASMASMASMVGVDRRWWTGVFDTEGTDVEVPVVSLACTEVACFQSEQFARELSRSLDLSEFVSLARQFACYQMSFFTVCSAWSW